jgi:SAM-dependent methyltransferase
MTNPASTFNVAADSYDRFMGAWSRPLAAPMADLAGVRAGQRALDVGCGPGALTTELVARLGPGSVAAVDPSEPFVVAARERHPGVDVRRAAAEALPFDDGSFDAALAQLVVHFLVDAGAGLREMARVTRAGGSVAACVWDHAGARGPLGLFWAVARAVDPGVEDESDLPGARAGHLVELFGAAGLRDVRGTELRVDRTFASFDDWWEPFTLGVGPAGAFVAGLTDRARATMRERCREVLGDGPIELAAQAWAAVGRA